MPPTLRHFTSVLYTPNQSKLLYEVDRFQSECDRCYIYYGLKCEMDLPNHQRTYMSVLKDFHGSDIQYTLITPEK